MYRGISSWRYVGWKKIVSQNITFHNVRHECKMTDNLWFAGLGSNTYCISFLSNIRKTLLDWVRTRAYTVEVKEEYERYEMTQVRLKFQARRRKRIPGSGSDTEEEEPDSDNESSKKLSDSEKTQSEEENVTHFLLLSLSLIHVIWNKKIYIFELNLPNVSSNLENESNERIPIIKLIRSDDELEKLLPPIVKLKDEQKNVMNSFIFIRFAGFWYEIMRI